MAWAYIHIHIRSGAIVVYTQEVPLPELICQFKGHQLPTYGAGKAAFRTSAPHKSVLRKLTESDGRVTGIRRAFIRRE